MIRAVQNTTGLCALALRQFRPARTNNLTLWRNSRIHTSSTLSKKARKEWVQDQSQREVSAILEADKIPGPSKKPVKLLTYEDEELGIMKLFQAKMMSEEKQLKLVAIDERSNPMIFKLMDGKQLMDYHRHNKKHPKKKPLKKLLLSLNTGEHDWDMKLKHVFEWLEHGHNVNVEVRSKRLTRDPDVGAMQADVLKRITETFQDRATVQQTTRTESSLHVLLIHKENQTTEVHRAENQSE